MATNKKAVGGKRAAASTGALIAEIPVSVVDISRGGCLLEAGRSFEPGTVGTLQLTVNGHTYVEDFRVARCTVLSGRGSTYRVGLEFLRTRRTADTTLRHAITNLVASNAAASAARPDHIEIAAAPTGPEAPWPGVEPTAATVVVAPAVPGLGTGPAARPADH